MDIYVYGDGAMCQEIFNAIALIAKGDAYKSLIKISMLFAIFTVVAQYIIKRNFMVKLSWLIQYFLLFSVLFVPKTSVEIHDKVYIASVPKVVANVPFGIAAIASITTTLGDGLTRLFEANFSLPDDLKYHQTGMVMASTIVTASNQFQITDPDIADNMNNFMQQCVFYDLYLDKYTLQDLLSSADLWTFIKGKASPARAFSYKEIPMPSAETEEDSTTSTTTTAERSNRIITCRDGAAKLDSLWARITDTAFNQYGAQLFPYAGASAKAELLKYLPVSYQHLANVSTDATNLLKQLLVKNAFESSVGMLGPSLDSASAMEAFAFVKAQQQKRLTNKTLGKQAAYWLPLLKNVIECVLYGSAIFVFLFSLLPNGFNVLKNYFLGLVWLQLWSPLYAIINLIISFYAKSSTSAIAAGSINVLNLSGIAEVNSDMAGLAGWLAMSVPLIAFYVCKFSAYTLTSVAQQLSGLVQSSATTAATEAASGNISLGNMNLDNNSAYNSSNFHVDNNARMMSGMYSEQLASGAMLSMTPGGNQILDTRPGTSSLNTSVSINDALSKSLSNTARQEISMAASSQKNYSDTMSATFQDVFDYSSSIAKDQSSGQSSSLSMKADQAQAFSTVHDMIEKTAKSHNIDSHELVRSLGSFSAGGNLHGDAKIKGIPMAGKLGYSHSFDSEEGQRQGQSYSAAKELMQDKRFTENLDTALQAVQSRSYTDNNQERSGLASNINNNYSKAMQLREDMSAHLQRAENFSDMASFAQTHGYAINTNASQDFFGWLSQQSGRGMHTGAMGAREAEHILRNEPAIAQNYAMQYVDEKGVALIDEMQKMQVQQEQQITSSYQTAREYMPDQASIESSYAHKKSETSILAKQDKGLDMTHHVSNEIKPEIDGLLSKNQQALSTQNLVIQDEDKKITQERDKQFSYGLNSRLRIKPLEDEKRFKPIIEEIKDVISTIIPKDKE